MSDEFEKISSESDNETETSFILKRDIYNHNGALLLAKGQKISMAAKRKLERLGIFSSSEMNGNNDAIFSALSIQNQPSETVLIPIIHGYGLRKGMHKNFLTVHSSKILTSIIFESKDKPWWVLINAMINYSEFLYTHSIDVAMLSLILAEELKYHDDKQWNVGLGAFLHDIGKVFLPESSIHESGSMTENEKLQLQEHCKIGANSLKIFNFDHVCLDIVLHHHGNIEGSELSELHQELEDEELSQEAQIVMVADVFDNLTSEQMNRSAHTIDEAINILKMDKKKYPQNMVLILEKIFSGIS